jgi:glutaredoxin 3
MKGDELIIMFLRIGRFGSQQVLNQLKSDIEKYPVLVYSKDYCPYCTQAKSTLSSLEIPFKVFELDSLPNGDALFKGLETLTNQSTVPNIFIGGDHIGGCSDLLSGLSSGKIQSLLTSKKIPFKSQIP